MRVVVNFVTEFGLAKMVDGTWYRISMFCQVSGNRIRTLRRTQREKGKVTTTSSQEMQNNNQPRNPRPVLLFLCRFDAAKKYLQYKYLVINPVLEKWIRRPEPEDKIFIFWPELVASSGPKQGNFVIYRSFFFTTTELRFSVSRLLMTHPTWPLHPSSFLHTLSYLRITCRYDQIITVNNGVKFIICFYIDFYFKLVSF